MKTVEIERFAYSPMGTFGILTVGFFSCYTVERPWRNNQSSRSCIPEGWYEMALGMYNKGGYPAYEILNVVDRSLIKVHVANTMSDVIGCIGLGKELGFIGGKWAVTQSTDTLEEFMRVMNGEPAKIIISRSEV